MLLFLWLRICQLLLRWQAVTSTKTENQKLCDVRHPDIHTHSYIVLFQCFHSLLILDSWSQLTRYVDCFIPVVCFKIWTPQMSDLDDLTNLTLSIEGRTVFSIIISQNTLVGIYYNWHIFAHPLVPPWYCDTQQTSQISLKNGGSDWLPRQRISTQYYVRALKTWRGWSQDEKWNTSHSSLTQSTIECCRWIDA